MKAIINAIYRRPYPAAFLSHMRNELGLTDEYKRVMDSLRENFADSRFHYENTMIPESRFEKILKRLNETELSELIRLAIIGFKTENAQ